MTRPRIVAGAIIGVLLAIALEVSAYGQDALVPGGPPADATGLRFIDWVIVNRLGGYLVVLPAIGAAATGAVSRARGWTLRLPSLRIEVTVKSGDHPFEVRNVRTGVQRVAVEVVEDASGGEASLSEITPDPPLANLRRIRTETPPPPRDRRGMPQRKH